MVGQEYLRAITERLLIDEPEHSVPMQPPQLLVAVLRGKPVPLEFRLRDSRLYGFALEAQT